LKTFKHFVHEALNVAFDLYTIVGGIALLFIVYGFLWLIVSIVWKKVHKESYDYVVDTVLGVFGKKNKEEHEGGGE
jgi:hypothetical protein